MFVSHLPGRNRPSQKALSFTLPRVQTIARKKYRGWNYEICHRLIGMTVKRDQFSASLWQDLHSFSEYLPSFGTSNEACNAAIRRIDYIEDILRGRVLHRETDGTFVVHEAHQPFPTPQSENHREKMIALFEQAMQHRAED